MKDDIITHFVILVILITFAVPVKGDVINVPDDYETIQGAVDNANDGDTVLVSPGVYAENIRVDMYDEEAYGFVLASLYLTTGDSSYIDSTVIDGNGEGTVIDLLMVVALRRDQGPVIVSGFTITNGSTENEGGGISLFNMNATVSHCVISDNYARNGGGVYLNYGRLEDCIITGNEADEDGGGILWWNWSEDVSISNCLIKENEARHNGGGVYCVGSGWLNECIIENNIAELGGGIYFEDAVPLLENCEFIRNSADMGGGVYAINFLREYVFPGAIFYRCLVADNVSLSGGGAVFETYNTILLNCTITKNESDTGSAVEGGFIMANSIIWDNSPSDYSRDWSDIVYSNIGNGYEGEGNIDEDPLFADLENGNYHLTEGSPCINAGTTLLVARNDTLLNLTPDDYNGNAPDMGAFESEFTGVESEYLPLPDEFFLYQNYPNPFNAVTTIKFALPEADHVNLRVFDLEGREVAILADRQFVAGHHSAHWNATDFSSGVYFYRIQAGEFVGVKKVMLML